MQRSYTLFIVLFITLSSLAQVPLNAFLTSAKANAVLVNQYNPGLYIPSAKGNDLDKVYCTLNEEVDPDSLFNYLEKLESFTNRNTYSDTSSQVFGIGAARRWFYDRLTLISNSNGGRLIPSYLDFEMPGSASCGAGRFRNVLGVLPGSDTADNSVLIIEAHMDSRCEVRCDGICNAAGVDDNASGTALVLELARVLSPFDFKHTIVFMATVGEEQGLFGAEALSNYCIDNGISVKAVQNNDVIAGVVCGTTSSPPSCSGPQEIDSTSVRIFSFGNNLSPHKSYARFIRTIYNEKMKPIASIPMTVRIMDDEDRQGRGGDHIPFRQDGFTALRFSSSHEHGDANVTNPNYNDHQHTGKDILGYDTNNDGKIDSMFISLTYLKRNCQINGAALATAASTYSEPVFNISSTANGNVVEITSVHSNEEFRLGIRSSENEFDAMYTVADTNRFTLPSLSSGTYFISVANVNANGIMTIFGNEQPLVTGTLPGAILDTVILYSPNCNILSVEEIDRTLFDQIEMDQNIPNPFSDNTWIRISNNSSIYYNNCFIQLNQIDGRTLDRIPFSLMANSKKRIEVNEAGLPNGTIFYTLYINGVKIETKKMIREKL